MGANLLAASNYLRRLVRFEKEKQGKLDFGHKMRLSGTAFVATLVILAEASPQGINFGGSSTSSEKKEDIANRNYGQQSAPQIQQHQNQQCCCIPQQQQCLQNQHFTQGDDLVGEVDFLLQKGLKLTRKYIGSDQREDREPTWS